MPTRKSFSRLGLLLALSLLWTSPALAFDLPDSGDATLDVGGRIFADWAAISADNDLDDAGDFDGFGTEFRQVRLFMAGELYEAVFFKLQLDFAPDFDNQGVAAKDVYMGLRDIPLLGDLYVGHWFEPFGLEVQTSAKYLTFMERSPLNEAFGPSRQTGIRTLAAPAGGRLTYAVGAFQADTANGESAFNDSDDFDISGRVTFAPIMADAQVVHVGVSYLHRFLNEDQGGSLRFRARPEVHLSPERLADTGSIPASSTDNFGGELAAVFGPLSLQAEAVYALVSSEAADDPSFWGAYGYASFFLTGESRPYKAGNFGRVKPNRNFSLENGTPGALELAARVSHLDLDDQDIEGGELTGLTLGANWYLNPFTRVMLNYVYSSIEDSNAVLGVDEGSLNAVQMRFQVDF